MPLPVRNMNFAVGRLNFINWPGGDADYEAKAEFLVMTAKLGKEYVEFRRDRPDEPSYTWIITDEVYDDVSETLAGCLVRENEQKGSNEVDKKNRKLLYNPSTRTRNVQFSNFIIDLKTHVILYQYHSSIKRGAFERVFPELFNPSRRAEPPFEIDDVVNPTKLVDWVKKVHVTEVEIETVPSNPRPRRSNEQFDAVLRGVSAKRAKLNITAKNIEPFIPEELPPDKAQAQRPAANDRDNAAAAGAEIAEIDPKTTGIQLNPAEPQNFIDQFLNHASGGYGKFWLNGIDQEGQPTEFKSGRNNESVPIPGTNDRRELLERLRGEVKKALRLFNL